MSDRVAVFIDGSNVYHAFKATYGSGSYSPVRLARALAAGRSLVRIGFYIGAVPQQMGAQLYAGQQRFLAHLKQARELDVWTGRMAQTGGRWYEKGVDVKIATDLVAMAHRREYETAIVVSGDSDLAPAVREVRNLGLAVENAMPSAARSWHLLHESSKFVDMPRELFDACRP